MRGLFRHAAMLAGIFLSIGMRSSFAQDVADEYGKGSWLFHQCQAYVRLLDNPNSGNEADFHSGARCFDYLKGFVDGAMGNGQRPFCPGNATVETTVRIYVNYMQAHPKLLDDAKTTGILQAWREAYPCK
jgi:Rap1a immunity proteins